MTLTIPKSLATINRASNSIDIVVPGSGYEEAPYSIALNRIDTHEKLLGWICHIAPKGWPQTGTIIHDLVNAVAKAHPHIKIERSF